MGNNVLFAGAWFDAEAGLYLFGARWYDPATGKFLTREPVDAWANAEDFGNAYVYAANNPASYGDATGYGAERNIGRLVGGQPQRGGHGVAGAVSGALAGGATGAGIGFLIGGPAGAVIGGVFGAAVGGVAGYWW